ncbi:hypothetical protein LAZ67_11000927 [Cordylochernes scorpioides]|uniref:Ubiquitinyl hydrolase 1 n=1 Tax=Cordylochernes scorpioides TaxID=51811 RepID=A0ABY6L1Y3_9ARAC|nr:hypothetical protein LAZ67_11000927 [Cordylochernes scorpioides]
MAERFAFPNPSLYPIYTQTLSLEQEIDALLTKKSLPDDQKVKLLAELMRRYQRSFDTPPPPPQPIEPLNERNIDAEIINSVPITSKKYVDMIIQRLRSTNEVIWNQNGEIIINNQPIPQSNVVDIFTFLTTRKRKNVNVPVGFQDLAIKTNAKCKAGRALAFFIDFKKRKKMDQLLAKVYYNAEEPGSFGGIDQLAKSAKISKKSAQKWLETQDVYTLHKPVKLNFKRRKIIALDINELWQGDLVDMIKFSKFNKGYRYILTIVDVFSKRAYAIPIKRKNSTEIVKAFKNLFSKEKVVPKLLQTDEGTEFFNKPVQTLFKKYNIKHYHSYSDMKAANVERFNRTLKGKMWRLFTRRGSYKYIDALPDLIKSYNKTVNRVTKVAPDDVTPFMRDEIFNRLYPPSTAKRFKFEVGDRVRISKLRRTFRKSYLPGWSDEVFVISDRKNTVPATYILRDLKNELIKGSFYDFELQRVHKRDEDFWPIDRIIKTKGKGDTLLSHQFEYQATDPLIALDKFNEDIVKLLWSHNIKNHGQFDFRNDISTLNLPPNHKLIIFRNLYNYLKFPEATTLLPLGILIEEQKTISTEPIIRERTDKNIQSVFVYSDIYEEAECEAAASSKKDEPEATPSTTCHSQPNPEEEFRYGEYIFSINFEKLLLLDIMMSSTYQNNHQLTLLREKNSLSYQNKRSLANNGLDDVPIEVTSPSKPTAGLYNLGNTCYSNAVLQCLANTVPILEICRGEIATTERQFLKKFGMLLEDMWKQDGPLKPKEFHEYVGSLDSRFGNYTEEDSMEYLQFLICQLRNELNSPTESEAKTETTDKGLQSWQEYVQIESSPLVHIFASQVFKAIHCQSCPYTSERYEVYWDFSFPIPEKPNPTIHDCFTQLFEREVIEDYTCGKCNQKGCVKTFNISKWPKILKIQFFRFSAFDQQKINNMIHFPINLDLSQFGSTTKYDLYAVVNHFGNRDSGHYLADAKHPISGKWYRYDDKRVKGIESTQVVTSNAFILFYKESE